MLVRRTHKPPVTDRHEMGRLFDRFQYRFPHFGTWADPWGWMGELERPAGMLMPSLDIAETDEQFTIRIEVPGLGPDDFDLSVSGNVLTIRGEKKECTEDKGAEFYHCERHFGSFIRHVELPPSADFDAIEAEERHGVLTVTVKKLAGAGQTSRKIDVKATDEPFISSI
ncbi:MAG: Hsp20/alpha crystallin family protein [Planctomycetota bacterium]|jgi:HSP20 family protein